MPRPNFYASNHFLSQEMAKYFAAPAGFDARIVPAHVLLPGIAITYGILRGCGAIIKQCLEASQPLLYVDHAYFYETRTSVDRPREDGYFRIVRDGRYTNPLGNQPPDRWERLEIKIKPWRRDGSKVIVVPVSRYVAEFNGFDGRQWLNRTIQALSELTDRPITVKPKDSHNNIHGLDALFDDAWMLVAGDSNAALSALINGVPVICSEDNPAAPLGRHELSRVEDPYYPENREQHLWNLAYQQFTLKEISDGTARRIVEERR